jgi:hypothetical protein
VDPAVRDLLISFAALSAAQQHEAAVEILRRASVVGEGDVPPDALVEAAAELFRGLDAAEARNAAS